MTFTFSVAGPSRLPAQAAVRCGRRLGRRQASADAASTARAANEDSPAGPAIEDKESKAARKKEKELWATHDGYIRWLKTDAGKFRDVTRGEKVTWLGGAVPYGTNPSFKPPSPLGNDTQEHIYSQLSRKNRTIAQVAEQFNVSKARIDAIRKLKDVEREMVRQGLPLQQAFQEGMEPLLGIKTLRDAKSKIISDRLARDEASQRGATMGSRVEREEEERYEAGIGQGGAFSSEAAEIGSLERTVWEFRSEQMTMGERTAEAAARQAVSHDGLAAKLLAGVEAAPSTPESKQDTRPVSHEREPPSHEHRTKRTMFRFIDTSTTQRAGSNKQGTQRS